MIKICAIHHLGTITDLITFCDIWLLIVSWFTCYGIMILVLYWQFCNLLHHRNIQNTIILVSSFTQSLNQLIHSPSFIAQRQYWARGTSVLLFIGKEIEVHVFECNPQVFSQPTSHGWADSSPAGGAETEVVRRVDFQVTVLSWSCTEPIEKV